jgi:serine/threonine-protein kinase
VLVGTVGYMSPEQLLGERPPVSWDLWTLAVVAYESVTGALPFPVDSTDTWRRSVLAGRCTPLSRYLADPPARWADFFERCFASDRARRPASAAEFLRDLERALAS